MADHLRVVEPGLFASVQDFGRFGFQRFGISAAGAMDDVSMRIANHLCGNGLDAPLVEMTLIGGTFAVEAASCRLAATGGEFPLSINGAPAATYHAHDLGRGDSVRLGPARAGARAYLAVAGGFDIPPVLGSRSTHSRSRIGGIDGGPLKPGDLLPLAGTPPDAPALGLAADRILSTEGPIRVMLGPQDDAFTTAGIATFLASEYRVSAKSDRMGCQLEGPVVEHRAGFNIVSDGIMNGSIQVPGHGRPIVLLADRQTTGGYPKIATVIGPDLHRLAQRKPGDVVRFQAVGEREAAAIAVEHGEAVRAMLAAVRPALPQRGPLDADRLHDANLVSGVVSATGEAADARAC